MFLDGLAGAGEQAECGSNDFGLALGIVRRSERAAHRVMGDERSGNSHQRR